jgi:acetyl esterase/lipase
MRRGHSFVAAVCVLAVIGIAATGAARAAEKADVDVKNDITYATVAGEELKLDLAAPKGLDHVAPAVVMIHGGGWSAGKRQDMTALMKEAAARGFVSATVSYRFAPKHRFPAQIEDVKCAVRYLRAHSDELKIDPAHIGAMGISAGAHLSMMLGTLDSSDGMEGDGGNPQQPSKVQAVVSFVGPTNLVWPQYTEIQEQILDAFLNGKPMENQEACRRASPITYVNTGDAPILMFFGTKDPLIDVGNAMQMCEALTKAGVAGRCELLLGASHGWGGDEMKRTIDAAFDFLGQNLKK